MDELESRLFGAVSVTTEAAPANTIAAFMTPLGAEIATLPDS